jgi:GTP-binding protein HflX
VDQVLAELGVHDKPLLYVFNKIDRLDHDALLALQARVSNMLPNSVFVSAVAEDGLEPLRRALLAASRRSQLVTELRIPAADGKALAEVHRSGEVLEQRSDGAELILRARLDAASLGRLRRNGVKVDVD